MKKSAPGLIFELSFLFMAIPYYHRNLNLPGVDVWYRNRVSSVTDIAVCFSVFQWILRTYSYLHYNHHKKYIVHGFELNA